MIVPLEYEAISKSTDIKCEAETQQRSEPRQW
jgi:hypothetical protein